MSNMMSPDFCKMIESLDSIQTTRMNLLKACTEYETSILVNCPADRYDSLFEDYEALVRAVCNLLDLSTEAVDRAV